MNFNETAQQAAQKTLNIVNRELAFPSAHSETQLAILEAQKVELEAKIGA